MPTLLRIDNFAPANIKEAGRVAFDAAAAQAVVKLDSVEGIVTGDILFIGRRGTESAERCKVQSISDPNVTMTANFTKEHRRYQPVIALRGDQLKIYRAANVDGTEPADGVFTILATVDIDPDDPTTDYQDNAGSADYWYKFTYYNSVSSAETDRTQSDVVRGGSYGHYAKLDDIRQKAGFANNRNILDSTINKARIEAESEINSELIGYYNLPFADPIPPTIERICRLIAAGVLLNDEYGPVNIGASSKKGDAFMQEGRTLLKNIKSREAAVQDQLLRTLLLDASLTVASNFTEDHDDGSTRKFSVNQIF